MPTKQEQADAIAALVREQVATVDRMAPDALRVITPALREARDELRNDLKSWLSNVDNADRFTTLQRAKALRALEAAIDATARTQPAIANGLQLGRHAAGPLAVDNLDKEIVRLGSIFGESLSVPQIDTAAVIAQGDKLLYRLHTTSAKRYAGELGDDIRHQMTVGLVKGETIMQTVNRLRCLGGWRRAAEAIEPGAHAADIADGFFNRWRYKADRLIRTEVMNAYNVQHHAALEQINSERPDDEDPWLERWDASADLVTCEICKGLDRRVKKIDGVFTFEGRTFRAPPAHPHCRCVLIAWLARWGGIKGEVPAKSRTGRDVKPAKVVPIKQKAAAATQAIETSLQQQSKPATKEVVSNSLPPGARLGTLRRHGLVERDTATNRWVLNARGIAHFAQLATKKAKRAKGEGFVHCQICARQLAEVNGKVSLHGYNRPGWGFIVGQCRGAQQLPWEQSCDVLRKWIVELRQMLEANEASLARFEERETFYVEEYARDERGQMIYVRNKPRMARVEIGAADPRFAKAKARAKTELENTIGRLRDEITAQGKRLASWRPPAG